MYPNAKTSKLLQCVKWTDAYYDYDYYYYCYRPHEDQAWKNKRHRLRELLSTSEGYRASRAWRLQGE